MHSGRILSISLISICFFTAMGMVSHVSAQSIGFGFSGGMNLSTHLNHFRYSENDINLTLDPEIATGYQAGFIVRKNFSQSLRLQAEPTFILIGAQYSDTFALRGFEFQTESRTELLYVQLPVLLQLSTVPSRQTVYGRQRAKTTYHLSAGVFGGFLIDGHFTGTNTGEPIGISFEGTFSNNVRSQYSKYDGGAIVGIGLEHGTDNKIGIESRIQYSVFKSGNAPELSFATQNIAATFSVYFLF